VNKEVLHKNQLKKIKRPEIKLSPKKFLGAESSGGVGAFRCPTHPLAEGDRGLAVMATGHLGISSRADSGFGHAFASSTAANLSGHSRGRIDHPERFVSLANSRRVPQTYLR
jgi:hypothetical protein